MADAGVTHETIRASRVKVTALYNAAGEHLGHIEDIVIGKRDGRVKYAIMSFGGFLGIGEELHPLPWDILEYDPAKHGYVVPVSREQLAGAPRYTPDSEPDWQDETFHRSIDGYYAPERPV